MQNSWIIFFFFQLAVLCLELLPLFVCANFTKRLAFSCLFFFFKLKITSYTYDFCVLCNCHLHVLCCLLCNSCLLMLSNYTIILGLSGIFFCFILCFCGYILKCLSEQLPSNKFSFCNFGIKQFLKN